MKLIYFPPRLPLPLYVPYKKYKSLIAPSPPLIKKYYEQHVKDTQSKHIKFT